jgi:hypothetical protein
MEYSGDTSHGECDIVDIQEVADNRFKIVGVIEV